MSLLLLLIWFLAQLHIPLQAQIEPFLCFICPLRIHSMIERASVELEHSCLGASGWSAETRYPRYRLSADTHLPIQSMDSAGSHKADNADTTRTYQQPCDLAQFISNLATSLKTTLIKGEGIYRDCEP